MKARDRRERDNFFYSPWNKIILHDFSFVHIKEYEMQSKVSLIPEKTLKLRRS